MTLLSGVDCIFKSPKIKFTLNSKIRSGYLSLALGNRLKISEGLEDFDQSSSMAYTTMKPSGLPNAIYSNSPDHDLGITRDTTALVAIHQSDDGSFYL